MNLKYKINNLNFENLETVRERNQGIETVDKMKLIVH